MAGVSVPDAALSWGRAVGIDLRSMAFLAARELMMSATGRSGFGKATAGKPDPAKNSWAETDIVTVAKIAIIVIRRTSPM